MDDQDEVWMDEVWMDEEWMEHYESEICKIFENQEGGGERLSMKSLQDYMEKCPSQLWRSLHFVECLHDFLIEKLKASDCQDPALVAFVINFSCAYESRWLRTLGMDVITELVPRFHTHPSSVPEGVDYKNLTLELVLGKRKLPLLKLLIRYGVIPSQTSPSLAYTVFEMLWHVLNGVTKTKRGDNLHSRVYEYLFSLYTILCNSTKLSIACVSRRQTVAIVIGKLNNHVEYPEGEAVGAKWLKYYFEAIPVPFVVVREMENLILEPQSLTDVLDLSLVKAKFDRYNILFPDWNVLQPRSLKHLSRCAARSYLCRQGTLPDVISKLPLPNVLKDYLLVKYVVNESD